MYDISVIIPCLNEVDYIEDCLSSLLLDSSCQLSYEFVIVDGGSNDGTLLKVDSLQKKIPIPIRVLNNPNRITPISLNIGIKNSESTYVARVDVHAIYPPNYLANLFFWAKKLDAENVGVSIMTLPGGESEIALFVADVMSSKLGVGASTFRVSTVKAPLLVDTVPFGFFKREIFSNIGFFDEDLIRNQDDEFNGRIIKYGGSIFLLPGSRVKYFSRSTLSSFSKMLYQYGLFKPLASFKLRKLSSFRQLMPPALVVCFILTLIGIIWIENLFLLMPIFFYYLVLLVYGFGKYKYSIKSSLMFMFVATVAHLSYGVGYIYGFLKLLFNARFSDISDSR